LLGVNKILIAVEQDETARVVLQKATMLALAADAEIHVIRVIYDPNVDATIHDAEHRQQLRTFLLEAEETWLEEFIEDADSNVRLIESATIWNKDEYQGIIDACRDCEADMIIKAAHQPQGIDAVVHTPQDWSLLRQSKVPVMMVKPQAWADQPVILAAIDALHDDQEALNRKILSEAAQIATILHGHLDIVVAHPFVQPWVGPNTVPIDFDKVRQEVETEIRSTVKKLTDSEGIGYRYLSIQEGSTAGAVGHQVDKNDAEILVMGTVARDGIKGLVLGNTSESILYHVQCDVAVLR